MARKKKPLPLLENITITDIAAEGKAIAKVDGLAVFVPFVIPGDVVDLQIRRKKHSFAEAEAVNFHQYSPDRAKPFCPHFGVCGGCKWQILPYELQLHHKQKQVEETLRRIGKVELPEINAILGSRKTQEYRNKLEFGFCNKKWLTNEQVASGEVFDNMNAVGFHITGAFDKILDIEECHLMTDINNRLRNAIREYAFENIHKTFPEVTSLLYVNNTKCNDTIGDLDVCTYFGTDHIYEEMENLRFKVGPKSFYQTNSLQAYELYKVAREFASLTGNELVYDLYTGTGTIANFVAHQAQKVIGIEYVPEAIEDAKVNAELNHLNNTLFYAGDMKDILTQDFINEHGRPDVIITDPPRAGMHADVISTILFAEPKRIVYASCNPATQARDLTLLDEAYRVVKVQPVDMFPQTHHVENVVLLERRNKAE